MSHETRREIDARTDSGIDSESTATEVNTTSDWIAAALDLTNFQVSALSVAAGEPKSGQEILDELNAQPRDAEVTHGRIYPNLDTLVEEQLIEKNDRDRRTHEYPITHRGQQLLEAYLGWLEEATTVDAQVKTPSEEVRRLSVELNHFQVAGLIVLAKADGDEPTIGQDVKRFLEGAYDEELNHGRLYPNLDTLVNKGLVQKEQWDRRSNHHQLTKRGRDVVDARWRFLANQVNGGSA